MFDPRWQLFTYQRQERMDTAARFRLVRPEDHAPLRWRFLARLGRTMVTYGSRLQMRARPHTRRQTESEDLCVPTPLPRVSRSYTTK